MYCLYDKRKAKQYDEEDINLLNEKSTIMPFNLAMLSGVLISFRRDKVGPLVVQKIKLAG
jgi:hypothetical protein